MKRLITILALLSASAVLAAVKVDSLTPGFNFERLTVVGSGATGGQQIEVAVSNVLTCAVSVNTVTAAAGGGFTTVFNGLTRGVEHIVMVDGVTVGGTVMAKEIEWYNETGTTAMDNYGNVWSSSSSMNIAKEVPDRIVFTDTSEDGTGFATFKPSRVYSDDISTSIMKVTCGFANPYEYDALPDPASAIYGLSYATVGDPAIETTNLLMIVDGGAWVEVPAEVFTPDSDHEYVFEVSVAARSDAREIDYYVYDIDGQRKHLRHCVAGKDTEEGLSASFKFTGYGKVTRLRGDYYDPKLVDFSAHIDGYTVGTNFTTLAGTGRVTVKPRIETDMTNGTVRVKLIDGSGRVVAQRDVEFNGSEPFSFEFDRLDDGGRIEAGENYIFSYEVIRDGRSIDDMHGGDTAPTARSVDGIWIDEDAWTFMKARQGTGDWLYRSVDPREAQKRELPVVGDIVQIDTARSRCVYFDATNRTVDVRNSSIREIKFNLYYTEPGYNTNEPKFPTMEPEDLCGITLAQDDAGDGKLHYSVYDPDHDTWHVLGDTIAELDRTNVVVISITYPNPHKSTPGSVGYYHIDDSGKRELLATYSALKVPAVDTEGRSPNRIRFCGSGFVSWFKGRCYDAHLARVEEDEYWTIGDAIRAIGDSGKVIDPLWWCTYTVSEKSGKFGVNDPASRLSLAWPMGYVITITREGSIKYYLFRLSDNWIDYAIAEDAVESPAGKWTIKSVNGLAWIASKATNEWVNGEIVLDTDLTNLYEHVWTPIRGFTGTFDGNNKTITGLTDKGSPICWTNSLDLSAYGLFAAASNSVFRNVSFKEVSISNSADAVASLLGCSIGDLALTNVFVRSGNVTGGGQFVSGIVGYVGDFDKVSLRGNLNATTVKADTADLGGVAASGIANLGTNKTGVDGSVTVALNENRGAIETTVYPEANGGNVAQIVAGSDPDAKFDPAAVTVTGNIGTGDVSRVSMPGMELGSLTTLPVANLASVVSLQNGEFDYKRYIEANDSTDVVIDRWKRTARMTGSYLYNGVLNAAGIINDQITASLPGETVTVQDSYQIWTPVVLDRAITLDLDGKVIDMVFDDYTFKVTNADSQNAVVRNGTVTAPTGKLATRPDGDKWTKSADVTVVEWSEDYWEHAAYNAVSSEPVISLSSIAQNLAAGAPLTIVNDPDGYAVDAESNTLLYKGKKALALAPLGCSFTDNGDGSYVIELDDTTPPVINLALAPNGCESKITVTGAKADYEYCLQAVTTLAEAWDKETDKWVSPSKDGAVLEFTVNTSAPSGFYRIKTRKK